MLLVCLAPCLGWGAPCTLSDFESGADFAAWEAEGQISNCPDPCTPWPATLARLAGHATEGTYSCQVDLNPADYQGLKRYTFPTNDWSAYNTLFFDVENPTANALTLHIEISDTIHGEAWVNRYITDRALIPGINHVSLGLANLPLNHSPVEYLDTSSILVFSLTVWGQPGPATVYFDNLRLDFIQDDPDADAARNIWKFDVGTGDSRWTDFFTLAAGTTYPESPTHPFGWTDSNYRYSGDFGGPDDLVRDFVRPLPCCPDDDAASMTFRLDLPNGLYHVYAIARSGNLSEMPVMGYRIEAEGATVVDVPMDSSIFYSTDHFWRGLHEDYPLSVPAWELFEDTNFPAYSFATAVSDGRLDLRFVHAWVYAIIVYPDDPDIVAEMGTRIADLIAARRTQFESSYYINSPDDLTFTPTTEETARGYAA
jgi:hypothetical protein